MWIYQEVQWCVKGEHIAYKQSAFCRVHNYDKARGQVTSRMVGQVGQIGIKEGWMSKASSQHCWIYNV
mgnify:CR=1 FL=1